MYPKGDGKRDPRVIYDYKSESKNENCIIKKQLASYIAK